MTKTFLGIAFKFALLVYCQQGVQPWFSGPVHARGCIFVWKMKLLVRFPGSVYTDAHWKPKLLKRSPGRVEAFENVSVWTPKIQTFENSWSTACDVQWKSRMADHTRSNRIGVALTCKLLLLQLVSCEVNVTLVNWLVEHFSRWKEVKTGQSVDSYQTQCTE